MRKLVGNNRRWSTLAAVAAVCLAPFLADRADAADTVRIGGVPFYSSSLVYVAQDLGFWKDSGLDVQISDFAGGPLVNEALMGGGIDMGMGVGAGPAVALSSRGAAVVVVGGEAYAGDPAAPPDRIIVRGDSPIKDVKELDGKTVAVHAKGSISYVMLEVIAKANGIKPVVLEIPAPNQYVAVKRGDVAGAIAETPFPEQMMVEGDRSVYSLPNDAIAPYMAATVTLTTQKFAQEHPDIITKVLATSMRAARWIMDDRATAREMISARLKYRPEIVQAINPNCYKWSRNGLNLVSSIHWWGRQMKDLGMIQAEPDYSKYFVRSYADAAAASIGKASDPDFDALAKREVP